MRQSRPSEHTEWLNLVETAGPFLAGSVLKDLFPQGLEKIETPRRQRLRSAYEEWLEAVDDDDPQLDELHAEWIRMVLEEALEFDGEVLFSGDDLPSYRPDSHDVVFAPDHVLRSQSGDDLLFVSVYDPSTRLDQPGSKDWVVSPIERMKLLCRSHEVRVGLVTNGEQWALINAPVDNTTGHTIWYVRLWWQEPVTFKAFVSLLGLRRFCGPAEERIDQLLERSLAEHHEVTDTLGEQVRRAVEVLIQSLGRADEDRNGQLLRDVESTDLYNAGLTVMMRLVFLLCAEERELLLLGDPVYDKHYAISTLRAKLEEDAAIQGPQVLARRYDAWSRLLSVFRAVYGGVEHESLRLPAMGGSLFDPDRYPFLEGRAKGTSWKEYPASPLPIDNRTVMLLLRALQVLEHKGGARQLSYRGLVVEQIGHVYEGLLEYKVERVSELTLGLRGSKKVPRPTISLQRLKEIAAEGTSKAATKLAKLTGRSKSAITKALEQESDSMVLPALVAACGGDGNLARVVHPYAKLLQVDNWGTPLIYQAGSFAISLGVGRRESGSHYTPKSLTEPVVDTTLRPLLETMGERPTADQLLELKVCDPAMGSGAFLVEACRQLAVHVVEAWGRAEDAGSHITGKGVVIMEIGEEELLSPEPPDRLVAARRMVAEHCLYGVDKNQMAVELAKLSLWLVTLAKGRPFSFLDHKLRCGDSLVGVTKQQALRLSLTMGNPEIDWLAHRLKRDLTAAAGRREVLQGLGEFDHAQKKRVFEEAEDRLEDTRLIGDLVVTAFLGAENENARKELRREYRAKVEAWRSNEGSRSVLEEIVEDLRTSEKPVPPMHWEIEFQEVFSRENPGFDAIVGNPPFAYKNTLIASHRAYYLSWLQHLHEDTHGNSDLVAHFFRRAFDLVRTGGTIGMIATKTIRQGATRTTGLSWICKHGGVVYYAQRRVVWPGSAAVIASLVCLRRGHYGGPFLLDGKQVPKITAFLFHSGGHDDPAPLRANEGISFIGALVYGPGFTFDDQDTSGLASSSKDLHALKQKNPRNAERVFPYMDGSNINSSPTMTPLRHVIGFDQMTLEEARAWPDLLDIVEERVRPSREALPSTNATSRRRKEMWWQWGAYTPGLSEAAKQCDSVLVHSLVTRHWCLAFMPSDVVFANTVNVFVGATWSSFAHLQCRVHEVWARFFGSSMKDDFRYTVTTCSKPYPFLANWSSDEELSASGREYARCRHQWMERNGAGLTQLYNRFHDPSEEDAGILRLREMHAKMDRDVLNAYGWHDVPTECVWVDQLSGRTRDQLPGDQSDVSSKVDLRLQWPPDVQEEVLARLLALNQARHEHETSRGCAAGAPTRNLFEQSDPSGPNEAFDHQRIG